MGGLKAESIVWVDQIEAIHAEYQRKPSSKRSDLKTALNCRDSQLTILLKLDDCFDPAAITKVRQATQNPNPFILSSNSALALAGLKNKVKTEDLHGLVHAGLDVIFALRLDTRHVKALVDWIISGNPAESFDPKAKPSKTTVEPSSPTPSKSQAHHLEQFTELVKKAEAEKARGDGQTAAQEELKAHFQKMNEKLEGAKVERVEDSGRKEKTGKKPKSSSDGGPSLFWEWMLGVKFMSQLRSKAKKGELTPTDKLLIFIDWVLVKPFGLVFKHLGKLFAESLKGIWHSIKQACGKTFTRILEWAIPILIICALVWGIGKVYQYTIANPLRWIESEIKSGFHWGGSKDEAPAAPSASNPQDEKQVLSVPDVSPKGISSPKKEIGAASRKIEKPAPAVAYQPAVSFVPNPASTQTLYDPKILDFEIKSLPGNYVVVKDYPLTPDEGMPVDVAVSRMQNIADPDKYTMMIGGGKQIISSVNPTNTTLTIQYKSADPFGLFGGSNGVMNFLWEDVKYIHANEIETVRSSELGSSQLKTSNSSLLTSNSGDVIYQCSLVVSGSKYPLTIQCATADDLEHLVSTMQYFIRHSRLAHDTALAGMPYPNQGLRLNDECLVGVLWSNSPVDKAGVNLGDMVWSVDKNAEDQPDRKKLEAQLGALTSGPHDLYIVSPKDRNAGLVQMNAANSNVFNPKRHKVVLAAF
jgi:hypothetical protein